MRLKDLSLRGIITGDIRYPWTYCHVLYDRFFDLFPERTEELNYDETEKLLEETPQGVWQIKDFIVGPFGLLHSRAKRRFEQNLDVPLWHCSDPSCQNFHSVELSRGKWEVRLAADMILEEAEEKGHALSEWDRFFTNTCLDEDYYNDLHASHFPWLVANCFSKREKQSILNKLLFMYPGEIRGLFPKRKNFKSILSGTAKNICDKLSESETFQLILLMDNDAVIICIECLINEGKIHIPATETRTSYTAYGHFGWLVIMCELSNFGVRFVSKTRDIALRRLRRLIMKLNNNGKPYSQLEWKLRHVDGINVQEKLDIYIHDKEPHDIIREFVFGSRENLQKAFKILRYGWFEFPDDPKSEINLIDKILWKLGFDVCSHPEYLSLFWKRYDNLLSFIGKHKVINERDRELVRSAGVNFFVSLEEILDYSLSFFSWILLSDHYGVTKFNCNLDEARSFMANQLSGLKNISKEVFDFDPEGKNTLYPLTQGFKILANLCLEIIKNDENKFMRAAGCIPGYHMKTDIEQFPFMHTILLLDLSEKEQEEIIKNLIEVASELERSNVCNVRNRIEHRRVNFPNGDEIKETCNIVAKIINKMETLGICPIVYIYKAYKVDQFGRGIVFLEDYKGRKFDVRLPGQFMMLGMPSSRSPQIIVPSLHVGESADFLRFSFKESSDYVDLWKDYPKRRTRLGPEQTISDD